VEPYLVASSVIGVIAQRLVRLICKQCRTEYAPTDRELAGIGVAMKDVPGGKLYKGRGCPYCLNSGYHDRSAIFEIFTVDDVVREQTMRRLGSTFIKSDALKRGMRTLRMDGARKVLAGRTTPEEVMRVTQMDTF
jgi:type II secretory ATPase GspE/PulE/Tfp pilus assembly ATPase PilB-like protein